jgi:uncharacterized membrane protein
VSKGRLEAFSDGVLAVIITIMVLEMKAPAGHEWSDLGSLWPVFVSYVLSFVFLGIYWNNHHHLLQAVKLVNGRVLWANLHLLFWLSLTPFVTSWIGESHFASTPVAVYGAVLLCSGIAYTILVLTLVALHGKDSTVAVASGRDFKGKVSIALYAAGIPLAFVYPWASCALYGSVAIMWLVPDRRLEKALLAE